MSEYDMIEQIAHLLAEAWDEGKRAGLRQSDWEHGDTPRQYIAVNPYRKEQAEMNSDLAEAWDKGAETAWNRSTPEVNGTRYHWRHEGEPVNPYRREQDEWCRAETCTWRHWQSGSVPTHKRGADCPKGQDS